jgi:hypothetical protein
VNPFRESPGTPYTRRTPELFNNATIASATLEATACSFQVRHPACDSQ